MSILNCRKAILGLLVSPLLMNMVLAASLNPDSVAKTIREAKILTAGYEVKPTISVDRVIITTFRNPYASDKDCRVDALLIARRINSLDAKNIKTVEVYFYDTKNENKYTKVVVSMHDILRFGQGQINQQQLFGGVLLSEGELKGGQHASALGHFRQQNYMQILERPDVVSGAFSKERASLLSQIRQLEKVKINRQTLQQLAENFVVVEDLARYNHKDTLVREMNVLQDRINQTVKNANLRTEQINHHPASEGSANFNEAQIMSQFGADAPKPGPMFQQRLMVIKRIRELEKKGIPSSDLQEMRRWYKEAESSAQRRAEDELRSQLMFIRSRLAQFDRPENRW